MPAVQPPSKVLVTGANGYIAVWLVKSLLEKGYAVRGTVRSADKAKQVADILTGYGEKLELVVVEDITKVRCDLIQGVINVVLILYCGSCVGRRL